MKPGKLSANHIIDPQVAKLINDHASWIAGFLEYLEVEDRPALITMYKTYARQGYFDYYQGVYTHYNDWLARTVYDHFQKHAREDDEAL